jgi:hypothetical protein
LAEGTRWWKEIEEDATDAATDAAATNPEWYNVEEILRPWCQLISWFGTNGLAHPSFVWTDEDYSGPVAMTLGCVFPHLIIGISDKGSLIGIMTHVVG